MRQGSGTISRSSGRYRLAARTIFALTAVLLAGLGLASAATANPSGVAEHEVRANPARVADGWSRSELLAAKPAPMPKPPAAAFDLPEMDASVSAASGPFYPEDPTAYPERLQGKVFFSIGAELYQCSGTLVGSRKGGVVYTAGHCVWDVATKAWVSNFVFIPGYEGGSSPFETYAATHLTAPSGYVDNGDFSYDIGMATFTPPGGPPVSPLEADLGGSRQIAFDRTVANRDYTLYGYPALPEPPYDGEKLVGCRSSVTVRDMGIPAPIGVEPCDMRQGASGGGWITGGNYLNSITSYTYCGTNPKLCDVVFGPYFSNAAKALYTSEHSGGSVNPSLRLKSVPPRKVRKRKVVFRFKGTGSTPIGFRCKFDRRRYVRCGKRTSIRRLSKGRHILRVRSIDQTGHKSKRTIKRVFRVLRKRR